MMYLTGASNWTIVPHAYELNIGLMAQPGSGYGRHLPYYPYWSADNGCFSQGDRFDVDRWLCWLRKLAPFREHCLFAVLPDVYPDAAATFARSLPVVNAVRSLGFRTAIVAQNGATPEETPWSALDALFIGGDTQWKLSLAAADMVRSGRRRGKWIHMGRVNSEKRLRLAHLMGCHSADGTFLAFGPNTNLPRLAGFLKAVRQEPMLPFPD